MLAGRYCIPCRKVSFISEGYYLLFKEKNLQRGLIGGPFPAFCGNFYVSASFLLSSFRHFSMSFFPVFRNFSKPPFGFRSFEKQFYIFRRYFRVFPVFRDSKMSFSDFKNTFRFLFSTELFFLFQLFGPLFQCFSSFPSLQ